MVIRTYFDKSNTIVSNANVNTGLNPVTELFYGGTGSQQQYSRFLLYFDETRIKELYTGDTFTDLTKLKHTLRMTNTGSFDKELLNKNMGSKDRTASFDLIAFKINQPWDNGVGYDYEIPILTNGDTSFNNGVSNWVNARTGVEWANGAGVYSGSPSGITVSTQHFDKGNENIEMDVSDFVNGVLTGNTNYGLGIAYSRAYEIINTTELQYVGFFTNNTQTFYEPFIETTYSNHIKDDRNDFYLDKNNKLFLYVNLAGNPHNLDFNPTVDIYDNDVLFSGFSGNEVNHVTKGVYSIDLLVPTTTENIETMYTDIWSNIYIDGVARPDISLDFVVKDSLGYYNIGNTDYLPKKVGLTVSGIKHNEKIKRGDIRKILVSARIPYTVEQNQKISDLEYRLYVKEGSAELTVIDFQPVEATPNNYYFLIDTSSLIPNVYYLDMKVTSNLEVTTIKENIKFEIVNQVDLRNSQ
jgi:hypothetical protein